MKVILGIPDAFSEQGQKSNQEDRYMPPRSEMPESRCFILCDGMGGHEHGEVAAEIVSKTLYDFMTKGASVSGEDIMTEERFSKALNETNTELDKMAVTEGKRPGTTMTCLYFAENGVFAAHIGDSRIYQVRPGEGVIFKTRDHSLVNDLLRAGELTEEEAKTFPRKNVITRAMQPGLDRPFRADTALLTDIKAGDYFFMCCDGILEQLTDEQLVKILENTTLTDKEKLDSIYDVCFGRTRDNFTCILIPVKDVIGDPTTEAITAVVDVERPQAKATTSQPPTPKDTNNRKWLYWVIGLFFLVAVVAVGMIILTKNDDKLEETKPKAGPPVTEEDKKEIPNEEVQESEEILLYGNDENVGEVSDDDDNDDGEDDDNDEVVEPVPQKSKVKKPESKNDSPNLPTEEIGKKIKKGIQQQTVPPPPAPLKVKEEKKNKEEGDKNEG